jgi:hypothetical protein
MSPRHRFWAATAAGLLISLGAAPAAARSPRRARHIYVDCSRHRDGDGTRRRPLNQLAAVNRIALHPGWQILLRRGTTCKGFLAPRGSGSLTARVLIGAYGHGALPRIATDGASPDAVRVADESDLVIQELDISNHGDYTSPRRGVHVIATRAGTVRDIVVRDLQVHDVEGSDQKDLGGSGGIQVDDPSADVLIENNLVQDVNRSGIWVQGTGSDPRPDAGQPWPSATTGVVIRNNRLMRIGGDGIVPTSTDGAVVEDNVVCCGNLRGNFPNQFDAGIWTFHANGTVIQRNEVYDMRNGTADGTGYDIDYNQDGTVVQDNYGHDNAGGFILLCNDDEPHRLAELRFNLSIDEYVFNQSPCKIQSGEIGTLDGLRVYNNTFLTPSSEVWNDAGAPTPTLPEAGNFTFVNNIVYATQPQSTPFPCGSNCSHNLFFGMPPAGTDAVTADPLFVSGNSRGTGRLAAGAGFRLRAGSPAIGAGMAIAGGPASDYFGNPFSGTPTIGFYQPMMAPARPAG